MTHTSGGEKHCDIVFLKKTAQGLWPVIKLQTSGSRAKLINRFASTLLLQEAGINNNEFEATQPKTV